MDADAERQPAHLLRTAVFFLLLGVASCTNEANRRPDAATGQESSSQTSGSSPTVKKASPTAANSEDKTSGTTFVEEECGILHEKQAWFPRSSTQTPTYTSLCQNEEGCTPIEPNRFLIHGCKNVGPLCHATVILPKVIAAKGRGKNPLQTELDKLTEDDTKPGDCWLSSIDYTIHYNKNHILSLTVRVSGVGVYPSTNVNSYTFDTRTNRTLNASVFQIQRRKELASIVNAKLQKSLSKAPVVQPYSQKYNQRRYFDEAMLDSFFITDDGVVFVYGFGVPHGDREMTPLSELFVPFEALREYVDINGALGWLKKRQAQLGNHELRCREKPAKA